MRNPRPVSANVLALLLGVLLFARNAAADAPSDGDGLLRVPAPVTTVGIGFDYSRGEFDTDVNTTLASLAPFVRLDWETITVRGSLPFFDIRGAFNPINDDDVESERGVGDLTASLSYTAIPPRRGLPFFEFTTKIKFPTAESGFGTDKFDVTLLADITHVFDDTLLVFADLGYRFRGGKRFRNTLLTTLGGGTQLKDGVGLWLAYDWRQSPITHDESRGIRNPGDEHELVPFLSLPVGAHLRVDPYLVIGLAKASPDWGVGTSISWKFQ